MVQIFWYKYLYRLKKESPVQDLLDFILITQKELDEFSACPLSNALGTTYEE